VGVGSFFTVKKRYRTGADTVAARRDFGYAPLISLKEFAPEYQDD
jgi:hypothetical protein